MASTRWSWKTATEATKRPEHDRRTAEPAASAPRRAWGMAPGSALRMLLLGGVTFFFGVAVASGPRPVQASGDAAKRASRAEREVRAREGELELVRLELARSNAIMEHSARFAIPADLAAEIYDMATAEGIEPTIAFRLVRVESDFTHNAVSPKGAVGLTQIMPSTARELNPKVRREDLFHRETNLRMGFAYLRDLIRAYRGDIRLALLAYNRGPAVVDAIRKQGGDPENGYARAILGPRRVEPRPTQPRR
ncbi:MAG TPA: lytic transglycosylase domain-containing protein [Longimicrobiales bacterium]|nr:lytic transglycosylase domain-containing protein [Longimicrobiales bacterium]